MKNKIVDLMETIESSMPSTNNGGVSQTEF